MEMLLLWRSTLAKLAGESWIAQVCPHLTWRSCCLQLGGMMPRGWLWTSVVGRYNAYLCKLRPYRYEFPSSSCQIMGSDFLEQLQLRFLFDGGQVCFEVWYWFGGSCFTIADYPRDYHFDYSDVEMNLMKRLNLEVAYQQEQGKLGFRFQWIASCKESELKGQYWQREVNWWKESHSGHKINPKLATIQTLSCFISKLPSLGLGSDSVFGIKNSWAGAFRSTAKDSFSKWRLLAKFILWISLLSYSSYIF